MRKSWLIAGVGLYLLFLLVILPFVIGIPWSLVFQGDAASYSRAAINILQHGFYSLDGIHPYLVREPGMSMFLAVIYFFSGVEQPLPFVIVQALILLLASWFFCSQIASTYGQRIAGITFILLLTSGSVFHTVFVAYRECLTLCLWLVFGGVFLWQQRTPTWWKPAVLGLILAGIILTYYSFIFFPPVLLLLSLIQRRPLRDSLIIIVTCYALVGLWGLRNASYDGKFRIIDVHRTTVMWYVRGEQAERVQGFEPFRCLWSEYISRDWTGRSDACSFNGLMHRRWPNDTDQPDDYAAVAKAGQAKIISHLPSYLNFSLYEILELHLPFVGGGFSRAFNVFAALSTLVMYVGCFAGISSVFRKEHLLWVAIPCYNILVFILTDATPRYLLPVIFCYALLAAAGYSRLFHLLRPQLRRCGTPLGSRGFRERCGRNAATNEP